MQLFFLITFLFYHVAWSPNENADFAVLSQAETIENQTAETTQEMAMQEKQ